MIVKNNARYKLTNLYNKLERSGENEFKSRKEFSDWAYESGYKPWKILERTDSKLGYSPENCYWGSSKYGRGKLEPVSENGSTDNIIKIIKKLDYSTREIAKSLIETQSLCEKLKKTTLVDELIIVDINNSLRKASDYLLDTINNIDNIEVVEELQNG